MRNEPRSHIQYFGIGGGGGEGDKQEVFLLHLTAFYPYKPLSRENVRGVHVACTTEWVHRPLSAPFPLFREYKLYKEWLRSR